MSNDALDAPICNTDTLNRLRAIKGFVFDMDGTLVLGNKHGRGFNTLPGAPQMLEWLRKSAIPFIVFTNGTARRPKHYAGQLREAGLDVLDSEMMTPATCAADVFSTRKFRRVMVLGGEGMTEPLSEAGIETVPSRGHEEVDAVFTGWFREFGMEDLEAAYYAVSKGAEYFSASQAPFYATASGRALGTSRVISAMIHDVTGCDVHIVGKPSLSAFESAARRLGLPVTDIAVVGDDPELEVPMALLGNAMAIAVDSGLGSPDAYTALPKAQQPHLQLENVQRLLELLR